MMKTTNQKRLIPQSIWTSTDLTLDNFSQKVYEVTGEQRRFKVTKEQRQLIMEGKLTREQAFQQTIEKMRSL